MLRSVKLKSKEDIYSIVETQQQRDKVEALEQYFMLRERPERITDLGLLERALVLMEKATDCTGEEYVFKLIRQSNIGSFVDLLPKDYLPNRTVNPIIRVYDKGYFQDRIRKLKGEAYQ